MPSFYWERFGSDARGGGRRFASGCCVWPDGSMGHRSCDSAERDRSEETLLQPLFSEALPDGPSLHERHHARDGSGCREALAVGGGGTACLSPLVCELRCSSTATEPFAKKSAT